LENKQNQEDAPMARKSVYVTRMIPEKNIEDLRQYFDVEVNPDDRALRKEELKAKIKGKDAVVTLLTDAIDGEVLDAAGPQLKIIANYAVGYNNFNLAAATERGVVLTNLPEFSMMPQLRRPSL